MRIVTDRPMARHARRVPAEATRALTRYGIKQGTEQGAGPAGSSGRRPDCKESRSSRTKQVVRRTGGGVGLAVPGDSDRNAAKPLGDGASER